MARTIPQVQKGDTIPPGIEGRFWTAGIHTRDHTGKRWGNRIEVYGRTKEDAEALRDDVMFALSQLIT